MPGALPSLLVFTALFMAAACGQNVREYGSGDEPQPARVVPDHSLVEDLRRGGYVIYLHHASTEPGGPDGPENLGIRWAQRNLSEEGRAEAREVGEAFRRLDIPVGQVRSSPFYRSLDTARLAFGHAEPTGALIGVRWDRTVQHHQREAAVLELLSTPPPEGTNTVLISDASNAEEFAGIPLAEGEAAVLQPLGDGEFGFVARITPEQWKDLSAYGTAHGGKELNAE